jgi:hypothetical protein
MKPTTCSVKAFIQIPTWKEIPHVLPDVKLDLTTGFCRLSTILGGGDPVWKWIFSNSGKPEILSVTVVSEWGDGTPRQISDLKTEIVSFSVDMETGRREVGLKIKSLSLYPDPSHGSLCAWLREDGLSFGKSLTASSTV